MDRRFSLLCCALIPLVVACNSVDYQGVADADPLIGGDATPSPTPTPAEPCDPANDLDGDGYCAPQDCDDFNSLVNPGELESCDSARDDDCDGFMDCEDSDCDGDPACGAGAENCTNGMDDDGDGAIDCADADCINDPACGGPGTETSCTNGVDDDGDGATDCADSDCAGDPACSGPGTETLCSNGLDDDGDGVADCADPDCAADPACNSGGACSGQDLLTDGGFEAGGSSWTQYSSGGWNLHYDATTAGVPAYSGNYLMWLGGADDELSYIEQTITIPAGATNVTLNYAYGMISDEWLAGSDEGAIFVLDSPLGTSLHDVLFFDDTFDTGGSWVAGSANITALAGQTVTVHVGIQTDFSLLIPSPTSLFVDGLSVICN